MLEPASQGGGGGGGIPEGFPDELEPTRHDMLEPASQGGKRVQRVFMTCKNPLVRGEGCPRVFVTC